MGEREITARSDVYALGAVLYEMLTGDPPFTGSTAQAIVARVVTESPRPLLPQRHTIPPHVEAAVLTALEKLPADRFGTAAEFAEALAGRGPRRDRGTAATAPAAAAAPAPSRACDRAGRWAAGRRARARGRGRGAGPGSGPRPRRWCTRSASTSARTRRCRRCQRVGGNGSRSRPTATGWSTSARRRRQPALAPGARQAPAHADRRDRERASPVLFPGRAPDRIHRQRRKLRGVSLDGGPRGTLTDSLNSPAVTGGPTATSTWRWMRDRAHPRHRRADRGSYDAVTRKEIGAEWPMVLPDAKGLVFRTRRADQSVSDFQIVAMPLPHGDAARAHARASTRATHPPATCWWSPPTASSSGCLRPGKLAITGPPVAVLEGIGIEVGGSRPTWPCPPPAPWCTPRGPRPGTGGRSGSPAKGWRPRWTRPGSRRAPSRRARSLPTGARSPSRWSRTATAQSGSSRSRSVRSRGSRSATRPTCARPGRRTDVR